MWLFLTEKDIKTLIKGIELSNNVTLSEGLTVKHMDNDNEYFFIAPDCVSAFCANRLSIDVVVPSKIRIFTYIDETLTGVITGYITGCKYHHDMTYDRVERLPPEDE